MLTMLAHHNCMRDEQSLSATSKTIEKDILVITRLELNLTTNDVISETYLRHFAWPSQTLNNSLTIPHYKCSTLGAAIGTIIGGTVIADIIGSAYTNSAPLALLAKVW